MIIVFLFDIYIMHNTGAEWEKITPDIKQLNDIISWPQCTQSASLQHPPAPPPEVYQGHSDYLPTSGTFFSPESLFSGAVPGNGDTPQWSSPEKLPRTPLGEMQLIWYEQEGQRSAGTNTDI